jgi:phage/plasmid-like protein (TIGR03299 family)
MMSSTWPSPWQGLGVSIISSSEEALTRANLDWSVEKIPIAQIFPDGTSKIINNEFSLTRSSDKSHLSIVGNAYKPVQNSEVWDAFSKLIKQASMEMSVVGSLNDGRHLWALAKIGYDFTIFDEDIIEGYALLSAPHKMGKGISIQHLNLRRYGMNTFLERNTKRISHVKMFDKSLNAVALDILTNAKDNSELFEEKAIKLSKSLASREDVKRYLLRVFDPSAYKSGSPIEKASRPAKIAYEMLDAQPGSRLKSSKNTWWGAFNTVVYTIDHKLGRDRNRALMSAWFGGRSTIKIKALDMALEHATI